MKPMKLSEMKTNDELIAEHLRTDPEFRAEWERTALRVRWRSPSSDTAPSTICRSASSPSDSA
jgi:hypothetical protein